MTCEGFSKWVVRVTRFIEVSAGFGWIDCPLPWQSLHCFSRMVEAVLNWASRQEVQ